ncbi:MAG TPA: FAD-binding oxidoreductase [Abditibacteriaceae bacterium]
MTELTGRVVQRGDPGWEGARRGFNSRFDYDAGGPNTVVFCQDKHDVAHAVTWARENKVPFRSRCGRHNYQGYSSLAEGGLIIDVNDMEMVQVNAQKSVATVGSGLNMLELSELLWDCGVTLPLATGPSVGLAGLTLGGGFGINSRKFGMTCDHLLNVEMVDADGKIINANDSENPDLFWACKGGGGGNFGIVTAFTFKVRPASLVAAFNIGYRWDEFDTVVDLWQHWAPEVDDGISSLLSLKVDRTITLLGQYTADEHDLPRVYSLLQPMLSRTLPISVSIQVAPHIAAARMFFGVDPANPQWAVREHSDEQIFKSTSSVAFEPFSMEAITTLRQFLEAVPPLSAPPSQASMVQLLGGGGAPSRVAPDATAVAYRDVKFIVQYDGYWTAPQDAEPTIGWVRQMRDTLLPHAWGAYVNYADDQLDKPLRAYFGTNLERLVQVKARYDPDNVFNFPQSIPPCL